MYGPVFSAGSYFEMNKNPIDNMIGKIYNLT